MNILKYAQLFFSTDAIYTNFYKSKKKETILLTKKVSAFHLTRTKNRYILIKNSAENLVFCLLYCKRKVITRRQKRA